MNKFHIHFSVLIQCSIEFIFGLSISMLYILLLCKWNMAHFHRLPPSQPNDPALQLLPWTLRRRKNWWRLEERCNTNTHTQSIVSSSPFFARCSLPHGEMRWGVLSVLHFCMLIYGLLIGITFANHANLNLIWCTFINRCAINDISSIITQNCEYWSWVGTYCTWRASVCVCSCVT